MRKITVLVFSATVMAASSAMFCSLLSDKSNKQPRKAIVNKENIAEIVEQLQRISKINWKTLDHVQILKEVKVKIKGRDANVAYLVKLIQAVSEVRWEVVCASFLNNESPARKERTAKELTKKEEIDGKELNLIQTITLLNGISEMVWMLFGDFIGSDTSKHPASHDCQLTIDGIRVDVVRIADRLEKFSKINWHQIEMHPEK